MRGSTAKNASFLLALAGTAWGGFGAYAGNSNGPARPGSKPSGVPQARREKRKRRALKVGRSR